MKSSGLSLFTFENFIIYTASCDYYEDDEELLSLASGETTGCELRETSFRFKRPLPLRENSAVESVAMPCADLDRSLSSESVFDFLSVFGDFLDCEGLSDDFFLGGDKESSSISSTSESAAA